MSILDDKNLIASLCEEFSSTADALRSVGMSLTGGSYRTFYKYCEKYGFAPPVGRNEPPGNKKSDEEVFRENSTYRNNSGLKKRLIEIGIKEECASCGSGPTWNGKDLTLQVDHINGVNTDNRVSNLRILCPNCHSQTDTWCGKSRRKINSCEDCNKPITKKAKRCNSCAQSVSKKGKYRVDWPSNEELLEMVWKAPCTHIAADLGVSSSAIKKRCKSIGIETPPRGYWQRRRYGKDSS